MRYLTAVLALALLFTAACGSEPTNLDGGGGPGVAAAISVELGADQSARPERAMPDSVVGRVTDDQGRGVEGQLVNFEVPSGSEAGSFDAGALSTNAQGRVFNELTAGTRAWTSRLLDGQDSAYTARLVASRDGRPDEIAEMTFAVDPGPPRRGSEPSGNERHDEDGTFDEFGDDGDAEAVIAANFGGAWEDPHENPIPFELALIDGDNVEIIKRSFQAYAVRATGATGTGTLRMWPTMGDSATHVIDGEYEVQNYQADGEQQTWICVAFEPMMLSDCEDPPSDL